jgi:flavin-dependent dehydrogenase
MTKKITICGAGPAGLTAALNLAQHDFTVTVYEKKKDVGMRFRGDLQGFENWSSKENIIEELKTMNIQPTFWYKPISIAEFYDYQRHYRQIHFEKPGLYLIRRGSMNNTLDQALKHQALDAGVTIKFNSHLNPKNANIIATGPRRVDGIVRGIVFQTSFERNPTIILDDRLAPKSFAYFLTGLQSGCLGTGLTSNYHLADQYLDQTISAFQKLFDFKINNPIRFTGYGNFFIQKKYSDNGCLFVGEAAGLQDYLLAFGLRQAITSGYLAAESIIHETSYNAMIRQRFSGQLKTSLVNRFLFRLARNKGYSSFLKKGEKINDPLGRMHSQYNPAPMKQLLYPLAKLSRRK